MSTLSLYAASKLCSTAGRFLQNLARDPFRPSGSRFTYLQKWARLNYCWINRRPTIPSRTAAALIPGIQKMTVPLEISFQDWNITPLELFYICCMAKATSPKTIFEFGTFDGCTTLHLARFCPQAEIHTLDLPNPQSHFEVGGRFRQTPESSRIQCIRADSRQYNFKPFEGRMEFIFIDAGHDYECVASDTKNAIRMAAKDATILWHDYLSCGGVKQAVDEIAKDHPVVHLMGTEIAVLQMGGHRKGLSDPGTVNGYLNDQLGTWLASD